MKKNSQVFISVLIVLTIVLALGAGMLFYSRSFRDATKLQVDTDKAYALAKSGINLGESFVAKSPTSPLPATTYNFADGTTTVEITSTVYALGQDSLVNGVITSKGKYKGSTRVMKKKFAKRIAASDTWVKDYYKINGDSVKCLQLTLDGGYIIGGNTGLQYQSPPQRMQVIKTDAQGNVAWAKIYGSSASPQDEILRFIQPTSDEGYIIGGYTMLLGGADSNYDFLVIKTDSQGNVAWAYTYGRVETKGQTTSYGAEYIWSVQEIPAGGGYFLIGSTSLSDPAKTANNYGILLVKINTSGAVQWGKTYGGSGTDFPHAMQLTADGGCIIGGESDSFSASMKDILIIKTDASGNAAQNPPTTWSKVFSGPQPETVNAIQQTPDGYIIGNDPNFLVIKTDTSGNMGPTYPGTWAIFYGRGGYSDTVHDLQRTSEGGYIFTGQESTFSSDDGFVIKTDSAGNMSWIRKFDELSGDVLRASKQIENGYLFAGSTNYFATQIDTLFIKTDSSGNVKSCTNYDHEVPLYTPYNITNTGYLNIFTPGLVVQTIPNANITTSRVDTKPEWSATSITLTIKPICPQ